MCRLRTKDSSTPIILSLVYAGGTILASKRSPYQDLIAEGFSDEALAERLKRQHRLICAAIHSGRIDDLKRMAGRQKEAPVQEENVPEAPEESRRLQAPAPVEEPFEIEYWPMTQEWTPPPPAPPPEETVVADDRPEQQFEFVDEPAGKS